MAAKKKSMKKTSSKKSAEAPSTTKSSANKKPGADIKPVSKKSRVTSQMDKTADKPAKSKGAATPSKKGKAGVASEDEGGRKKVSR